MIPLVSTVLFYVCAEATMEDELHGIVAVSVLVFIVAFFVAKMFTEVSWQLRRMFSKNAGLFNPSRLYVYTTQQAKAPNVARNTNLSNLGCRVKITHLHHRPTSQSV